MDGGIGSDIFTFPAIVQALCGTTDHKVLAAVGKALNFAKSTDENAQLQDVKRDGNSVRVTTIVKEKPQITIVNIE